MLEKETEVFNQKLPELVKTELGRFVVIKEDSVIASFSAIVDALSYGYEKFRDQPFFVRQVSLTQQPLEF